MRERFECRDCTHRWTVSHANVADDLLVVAAESFERMRTFGSFDALVAQLRASMGADAATEIGLDYFTSRVR